MVVPVVGGRRRRGWWKSTGESGQTTPACVFALGTFLVTRRLSLLTCQRARKPFAVNDKCPHGAM